MLKDNTKLECHLHLASPCQPGRPQALLLPGLATSRNVYVLTFFKVTIMSDAVQCPMSFAAGRASSSKHSLERPLVSCLQKHKLSYMRGQAVCSAQVLLQ